VMLGLMAGDRLSLLDDDCLGISYESRLNGT
jgi:hypothetical protein